MELRKLVLFWLTLIMADFGISIAFLRTHQLDWTTNNNFATWASIENVQVGDNIYFTYNEKEHNVLKVSSQDYQSCNTENPIAIFNSGIDILSITATGDYYFICGHQQHCQSGQKLHLSIGHPNPNPPPATPTNPSTPTTPTSPSTPTISNPSPSTPTICNPSPSTPTIFNPSSSTPTIGNPSPSVSNGGAVQCPPFSYYPYCKPLGDVYSTYSSSSSSIASKWLISFGVWAGILLASHFCVFSTM